MPCLPLQPWLFCTTSTISPWHSNLSMIEDIPHREAEGRILKTINLPSISGSDRNINDYRKEQHRSSLSLRHNIALCRH